MSSRNVRLSKKSTLNILTPSGDKIEIESRSDKQQPKDSSLQSGFYSILDWAIKSVLLYDDEGTIEELVTQAYQDLLKIKRGNS